MVTQASFMDRTFTFYIYKKKSNDLLPKAGNIKMSRTDNLRKNDAAS